MIEELPEENLFRKKYKEDFDKEFNSNIEFADMFLHPFETNLTLSDFFELLDQIDLQFLGFLDKRLCNLDSLLKGQLLYKTKTLYKRDQWKLIEDLDPEIVSFEVFISPKKIHT